MSHSLDKIGVPGWITYRAMCLIVMDNPCVKMMICQLG